MVISFTAYFLAEPELVKERSYIQPGIKSWDPVLASVSFLFFYPINMAVAGLDAGRYGWSPSIPWVIQIAALIVFAAGNGFALWAVLSNRYFSTFIRLQDDRGQEVVDAGPYRYIRHPGYVGFSGWLLSTPLLLSSNWAFIPAVLSVIGLVIRTALEDRMLQSELSGYTEYASRIQYRLIPGIW